MNTRIEKIPFFATFFKPAPPLKKGVEKSPYPAFFKELVKPVSAEGKIHKAIILREGIKAGAVRLFINILWGGKVVKGLQEVAREQKPIHEELKNRVGAEIEKRDMRGGASVYRSEGMAHLPKERLREIREDAGKTPKASSTELAEAHVKALKEKGSRCPEIKAGDGNSWMALRVSRKDKDNGRLEVFHGTACPTSERALGISNDLTNLYFHISDDGHLSITCGVIDTEEKAQQFMAGVAEALKYRDIMKPSQIFPDLRISLHQLNSMGSGPGVLVSERSLVTKQHQMADYLNQHLESYLKEQEVTFTGNGPFVAHVNRCLNGFTQIKGEDANAHPINREGLAIQMGWLHREIPVASNPCWNKQREVDATVKEIQKKKGELAEARKQHIDHFPDLRSVKKALDETEARLINTQIKMLDLPGEAHVDLEKLRNQVVGLQKLKKAYIAQLAPSQNEVGKTIKQLEKEIKTLDTKLEGQLQEQATAMHDFQQEIARQMEANPHDQTLKELHTKLKVGTHILAMQTGMTEKLGLPKLNTAQELGYQLLFDQLLHVVTEINCKSGLDRTGFARSLLNSIQQKIKNGESVETIVSFLDGFESQVKAMDREMREKMGDPSFDFKTWLKEDGKQYQAVYDFQSAVFAELIGVARPITGRSTGFEGLKWHHDKKSINPFEKNPHPVPFIPMFIDADGETVALVQINKKGQRSFTPDGNAVLMGLSARRGG